MDREPHHELRPRGVEQYRREAKALLRTVRGGHAAAQARARAALGDRVRDRLVQADARVCSAHEYGFRTWAELAEATDRAQRTRYSRLPPELPWKQAEAAIRAGDAERLRSLLDRHPALEHEDPLSIAACFGKPDMVGWLLDAGADPGAAAVVSPLQSTAYHGSRAAADVLVHRSGIVPDTF